VYSHVAPVAGVRTVFATVEYPVDEPPEEITIAGTGYRTVRIADMVRREYGDGIGHYECSACGSHVLRDDLFCRKCGATLDR
jgi:hypothetical protein